MTANLLFHAVKSRRKDLLLSAVKLIKANLKSYEEYKGSCTGDVSKPPEPELHMTFNAVDDKGKTALMWAAELGLEDAFFILLENEADHRVKDSQGRTALHYAAINGNNKIFKELIRLFGVKKLETKVTPSANAAPFTAEDWTQMSENVHPMDTRDAQFMTPLMYAAKGHHTEVIETLVEAKADANLLCRVYDYSGTTAKNKRHGQVSALHLLIDPDLDSARAEVKGANGQEDKETRRTNCVKALLKAKEIKLDLHDLVEIQEDLVKTDAKQVILQPHKTCLQKAAASCQSDTVTALLEKNANPYIVAMNGRQLAQYIEEFPIALAAASRSEPVKQALTISALLKSMKASDESIERPYKQIIQRAFEVAVRKCRPQAIRLLKVAGANAEVVYNDNENLLYDVVLAEDGVVDENERTESFRMLMEDYKLDVHARSTHKEQKNDRTDNTILIIAVRRAKNDIVKLLLEKSNADINAQDPNGATALFWAAAKGRADIVKTILLHNPKFDLKTKTTNSTIFHAAEYRKGKSNFSYQVTYQLVIAAQQQKRLDLLEAKKSSGDFLTPDSMPDWVQTEQKILERKASEAKAKKTIVPIDKKFESGKGDNPFKRYAVEVINRNKESMSDEIAKINAIAQQIFAYLHQDYLANDPANNEFLSKAFCVFQLGVTLTSGILYQSAGDKAQQTLLKEIMYIDIQLLRAQFSDFMNAINVSDLSVYLAQVVGKEKLTLLPQRPAENKQGNQAAADAHLGPTSASSATRQLIPPAPLPPNLLLDDQKKPTGAANSAATQGGSVKPPLARAPTPVSAQVPKNLLAQTGDPSSASGNPPLPPARAPSPAPLQSDKIPKKPQTGDASTPGGQPPPIPPRAKKPAAPAKVVAAAGVTPAPR